MDIEADHVEDGAAVLSSTSEGAAAMDSAIAELYRGPFETFVSRRDALAKELRGAGDRESASAIKALKKPSLAAWALNLAVLANPESMSALVAAIRLTVAAQSPGSGAGEALSGMRKAVREFAAEAAQAATNAGHDVDVGILVAALFAVLGKTESFEALRRGRIADLPEAGGLDLLALVPALPVDNARPPQPRPRREQADARAARESDARRRAARDSDARESDARQAALRERVNETATVLATAKAHSSEAREALDHAEAAVTAAEARLREAEKAAEKASSERDRARHEAEAATRALERAQAAFDEVRRQIRST